MLPLSECKMCIRDRFIGLGQQYWQKVMAESCYHRKTANEWVFIDRDKVEGRTLLIEMPGMQWNIFCADQSH